MNATIVRVRSVRGGHHRIGRYFGIEPIDIEARTLSRKELSALQSDPDLSVEVISEEETQIKGTPR